MYAENENVSDEYTDTFLNDQNPLFEKVSDQEKQDCDKMITNEECLSYLKHMRNNTSPGLDGFTVEFYKFFWRDIGPYLTRSLKYAISIGELSVTQKQGIVTLLPKPGKDSVYLKNWRPISLLNVDYKIFSGALSFRLKDVLNRIISKCQKGFLGGRDISECTRIIYDILHETKMKKITGILLICDFEKAFDSVSHKFLFKSLDFLGFGENFIKFVTMLYKNASSCILYNGHCTNFFKIEAGVRQGDPLSPYLFIIVVACLACELINNPNIKGIEIMGKSYLLSQYADDLTLFLEDNSDSLGMTIDILRKYESCSGVRVNFEKTEAVWIGGKIGSNSIIRTSTPLKWLKKPEFKILGIEYNLLEEDIIKHNYERKFENIKNLLNTWSWRSLTMFGKMTVIKSLAIPKLVHLLRALPNPDEQFFKKLDKIIFDFIWNGKPDKIKRSIMYNSIENGGANLTHMRSFSKSLKIYWIKKSLDDEISADWKSLLIDKLDNFGGNKVWFYHEKSYKTVTRNLNPFWKNLFEIWSELNDGKYAELDYRSRPLWLNPDIKIENKSVYFKSLSNLGINFVNDIIKEDGSFLQQTEIHNMMDVNTEISYYNALVRAIPNEWKVDIRQKRAKLESISHFWSEKLKNIQKPNKIAYKYIVSNFQEAPTKVIEKWNSKHNEEINISSYFTAQYKSLAHDTKMRAFQFKIMHRILATNRLLFKMKINPYDLCTFCFTCSESIEHLFWECTIIKNIWFAISNELNLENIIPNLNLGPKTIILGYVEENCHQKTFNIFLTLIKYYIFRCRLDNTDPSVMGIKSYVGYQCRIYKNIKNDLNFDFIHAWVDRFADRAEDT